MWFLFNKSLYFSVIPMLAFDSNTPHTVQHKRVFLLPILYNSNSGFDTIDRPNFLKITLHLSLTESFSPIFFLFLVLFRLILSLFIIHKWEFFFSLERFTFDQFLPTTGMFSLEALIGTYDVKQHLRFWRTPIYTFLILLVPGSYSPLFAGNIHTGIVDAYLKLNSPALNLAAFLHACLCPELL